MTIKYSIFCLFLILNSLLCFSQHKTKNIVEDNDSTPILYKWLGEDSKTLTHMGMVYTKPEKFKEIRQGECFEGYPRLESTFTCLSNPLLSNDRQFLAFMPIFFFTIENSKYITQLPPNHPHRKYINIAYLNNMRGVLKNYFGEDVDWQSMLRYYPEEEARSVFNADTVVRFTIALRPEDYYKKEYKYVDALFIQKKGRGYVNFYCFYTDKAKVHLDDYWKKIEGVLRYEK